MGSNYETVSSAESEVSPYTFSSEITEPPDTASVANTLQGFEIKGR
jgi:hypothetical protein